MIIDHRATTILACNELAAPQAFYERLGFIVTGAHGDYRILADGKGWHLHLQSAEPGWVSTSGQTAGGISFF